MKKILIIGSGGREHALGWKLKQSPQVGSIYFAPGNGGTGQLGENISIKSHEIKKLLAFAQKEKIDLTVVGPEDPLSLGITDLFEKKGLSVFGPTKNAARLESSKAWAAAFMKKYHIPQPAFYAFNNYEDACSFIEVHDVSQYVIKASGLALGKGVILPSSKKKALETIKKMMIDKEFGEAGNQIVIQEKLFGQEVSIMAFTDGKTFRTLLPSQDHKKAFDNDRGPNTGGVGAYAQLPFVDKALMKTIEETIVLPTINGMAKEGCPYKGILYPGLILTPSGPKVLEYNVRFGDPETQPLMMLLDSDLFSILQSCIEGTLHKEKIKFHKGAAVCVVLASKGYPGKYNKGEVISGLDKKYDNKKFIFHAGTTINDGRIITNGGRVLGVTATGDNIKTAVQKAYSVIGKKGIHFKNMQYRRDIGRKGIVKKNMINRLEIISKIPDARAAVRAKKLGCKVTIVDVYSIDRQFTDTQLKRIALMLTNSVTQIVSINKPLAPKKFSWAIEIGFLPGVTDNIANTATESAEDLLKIKFKNEERVYTSQITFIDGHIAKEEIIKIADSLYNPVIQRVGIKNYGHYKKDKGMGNVIPKVRLEQSRTVDEVDLNVSDEELINIGKKGIENTDGTGRGPLALDLTYMKTIKSYFNKLGRNPTDVELESIAQTWSEHCKHTIFNDPIDEIKDGLFKTYIKAATEKIRKKKSHDFCYSVFKDNSGAIEFDTQYLITHKVETHNSPSALDPFGGAITGIVGVNRDAIGFGLGAKPIINTYGFCFAEPDDITPIYKGPHLTQKMLEPKRIMTGVIEGVNSGGNCSGIPTPQGFMYFDRRYKGKPLVFVGTVGLIPKKHCQKKAQPGDYIVMIGGKVGQDGIHGATFSSEAMDSGSPATAVQIGDPITQKKLSDAVVKEARDLGLYNSITDNGAGGLSCSVAEMAKESGGCIVELEKVPLKYSNLEPWKIWISESQERMTLAVPKKKWKQLSKLMKKREVEATIIGVFTKEATCIVKYHGHTIMNIDMKFLHDGLPKRPMKTESKKIRFPLPSFSEPRNLINVLQQMVKRLNIAGFEFLSMQYDHEIQAGSVVKPLQGRGRVNDETTVTQPVLSSDKGVVLSQGLYPSYSDIDAYHMAACSIDTAIRNAVSSGADPDRLALLDNFCWCSPDDPERLGQLKKAAQACFDYAVSFGTPFISGKDSMFNDFKGYDEKGSPIKISIPPTVLISSIGVIDDVGKTVSIDIKFPGDLIYILGETYEELGGSEYYAYHSVIGNDVPHVDATKNKKVYRSLYKAIQKGLIVSSISVTRGGLGIALAKMAMAGMLGIDVSLEMMPGKYKRDDYVLFSETQGRIIITIDPKNKKVFESMMKGNNFAQIGEVRKDLLFQITNDKGKKIIETNVKELLILYKKTFMHY